MYIKYFFIYILKLVDMNVVYLGKYNCFVINILGSDFGIILVKGRYMNFFMKI